MSKTKLIINNNGSIKIEGDFEIMDSSGMVYGLEGRTALGLCRCGLSASKPFCDGSSKYFWTWIESVWFAEWKRNRQSCFLFKS
jgi:hypothetical protein